jgi:hypothetical protein
MCIVQFSFCAFGFAELKVLEILIFVDVAFAVVGFGSEDDTNGLGRKVAKFTPHIGRNENTRLGRVHVIGLFALTIIYPHIETAAYGKHNFGTSGVGMSSAGFALWHSINPEHTLDREGQLRVFSKAE